MIHLALRFDDPSATSNVDLEQAIFGRLQAQHARATVAVIPFKRKDDVTMTLDAARASHLISAHRAGIIEIALHGYAHQAQASNPHTEFAGVAGRTQQTWVAEGLACLRAIFGPAVTGFVPPFNSYDAATLDALRTLDLRYVSAGWKGPLDARVAMLPRTCQMVDLREAVMEARTLGASQSVIVGVMHHYDFLESGAAGARIDLPAFESLLAWLNSQSDIQMKTLVELATGPVNQFIADALKGRRRLQALPAWLSHHLPQRSLCAVSLGRLFRTRVFGVH